jgi:hypothetical protein
MAKKRALGKICFQLPEKLGASYIGYQDEDNTAKI